MNQLPAQPYILFVGALARHKGLHTLLAAYQRLDAAPPLLLIGTSWPDTPTVLPPGATIMTNLPHAEVMVAWEGCLFGVLPSICAEALGDVVIEAMSAGKAMIGSRAGGIVDLIDEGETGLLVPPGDVDALAEAMNCLIQEPSLRETMGRRARRRAQRFLPTTIMPQFISLYEKVVNQR
ncbi:MAG TPA: glycosyltransferase [Candidatus Dormibacteraeota bacterium]|nr:glycosyltransferase [Candidatus Dormibacteraeota bacterium]